MQGAQQGFFRENLPLAVITKCRILQQRVNRILGTEPHERVFNIMVTYAEGGIKLSPINKKLFIKSQDAEINGPPSYLTRIREGIPVPNSVEEYRDSYRRIFKMEISTKALEVGFCVLNRTIWTNSKQYASQARQRELGLIDENASTDLCPLCNEVENTIHIMTDCDQYSYRIWTELEEAITIIVRREEVDNPRVTINLFNVIYNVPLNNLPSKYRKESDIMIQEMKRFILQKRMQRIERNMQDRRINNGRLRAHISNFLGKLVTYRKQFNKSVGLLSPLHEEFMDDIDN